MKALASVWPSLAEPRSAWAGRWASSPSWARAAVFGLNCQHRRRDPQNADSEKLGKNVSKVPGGEAPP